MEIKPMSTGYILEVKLTGQVERWDGEGRGEDGGMKERKYQQLIMPKFFNVSMRGLRVSFSKIGKPE